MSAHRTFQRKVPDVGVGQALDEVLLDAARRGDQRVHHAVLNQVADVLAGACMGRGVEGEGGVGSFLPMRCAGGMRRGVADVLLGAWKR